MLASQLYLSRRVSLCIQVLTVGHKNKYFSMSQGPYALQVMVMGDLEALDLSHNAIEV